MRYDRGALLRGTALGAMAAFGIGLPALAEETTTGAEALPPVSVEAEAEKPPTVTTITRETLDDQQVQSVEDLARRVDPSINFDRSNRSINIRGLDQGRVLTTLDGIRLPYLVYGARDGGGPVSSRPGGVDTFAFDGLSSLDVYKGAESAAFGSGAMGGVLALRSLTPEDLLTDGRTMGGIAKGGYSSEDESWFSQFGAAGRYKDTWFLVQGGYADGHETDNQGDVDGYGSTRTKANPDDYDRYNGLFTLHQYVDGGHRFGLTGEIYHREDDFDMRTSSGTSTYAPGDYGMNEESERQRVSLDYKFTAPSAGGWIDEAEAIAYWQKVELTSVRDAVRQISPVGIFNQTNTNQIEALGISGKAISRFELGAIGNTLRYGGEFIADETKQFSSSDNNCPAVVIPYSTCYFLHDNQADAPTAKGRTLGLFAENEIALADGLFTITPGLRFDWYEQKPQDDGDYQSNANYSGALADSSDSKFSPKVLLQWHPAADVTLFAQWEQSFRAPNPAELYLTYGSVGTYAVVGNPDLKPETANNFEVGADVGDESLGGRLSVFNNYYRNFIDQVGDSSFDPNYPMGVTRYVNRAKVQIYGVELSGQWAFAPGWKTWASLAVQTGKDTDEDVYLNSVPPLKTILGVAYDTETWGASASATLAASRDKFDSSVATADATLNRPGYEVFDIAGWWAPEFASGLKLQAGVYNLFDETYWNAVSIPDSTTLATDYYTEPGRNFRLTATYRF